MINICSVSEYHGHHYLTCKMVYTQNAAEYEKAENIIILFGIYYYKSSWNSELETITYRS